MLATPLSNATLGNEIILAINMKGRTLGGAYYDGQLSKLFVMQDVPDCNVLDMIETVQTQVRPTLILTSARLDEYVIDALRWNDDGSENKLEIRPGGDFLYQLAKTKLVSISIQSKQSERSTTASLGTGSSNAPQISADMDESVQRDAQIQLSNLIDLQNVESIFEDESHPSMHSSIRGRKEGLSLFGVLNQTKTSQGRHLLRQWLLRPSLRLTTINERHQTVECFLRTENQPTLNQLVESLGNIKNIPKVLQALSRKATIADWQAILQIYNASQEFFVGVSPVIQEIWRHFAIEDLMDIGKYINDVLDFDESVIEGRCVVKRNVDEDLDNMCQTYHGLDSFLSEVAKEISATIPSDFTSIINVIYFPQLGYLITVPMNPEWKSEEDYQLEGLTYKFSTESTVYYKNGYMQELDGHIGDIHGLIVDREIDILQALQERILEYSQLLVTCSDLCAELDVLVSLARVARLRNYKRPVMVQNNTLEIVNGRHPLQELVVDSFVTNNTLIGGTEQGESSGPGTTADPNTDTFSTTTGGANLENRVMIVSGPNSSGKSVYLKQVALITFMAHVGSFVPADAAAIGVTDKIFTRLQTRETVSSIQSAFMTDLQQVALAVRMSTARSLVILDEFGKGTTSTDGSGMFCGVIEHFARLTVDRPRVLATTHFHELFENQLLNLNLPISLYTMEVYQQPDCTEATFLFRVLPGKTPSSLGPACAAMASMPLHIVQRGVYLSGLFRRYEMVVPQLTTFEKEMQAMYERLTGMLLRLDLDVEQCETFWAQESAVDGEGSGEASVKMENTVTANTGIGEEMFAQDVKVGTKVSTAKDGESEPSAGTSSLGKRKQCDSSAQEGATAGSEVTGAANSGVENSWQDALNELLEYAAKVYLKENAENE
ncbi:MutS protein msh5 [Mortierella sp. NVP41]|nr:MutS protein msh5 [Mortierella sp. NVP41]